MQKKDAGFLYLGAQFSSTTAPCLHSKLKTIQKIEVKYKHIKTNYAEVPHVATKI